MICSFTHLPFRYGRMVLNIPLWAIFGENWRKFGGGVVVAKSSVRWKHFRHVIIIIKYNNFDLNRCNDYNLLSSLNDIIYIIHFVRLTLKSARFGDDLPKSKMADHLICQKMTSLNSSRAREPKDTILDASFKCYDHKHTYKLGPNLTWWWR